MTFVHEARTAIRLLIRDRRLTAAAVASLALGIAATTTVFTIVNAVVLREMPFDAPDRIVQLGVTTPRGNQNVSYPDLLDWRERTRSFDGIAAWAQRTMNVSEDALAPERFPGVYISANAFALIGHQPVLGRGFAPDDDRPGAPAVAIIGADVWRNRYRSDPGVIGRVIRVNSVPSVVIGVMGDRFKFPFSAEVWQPLSMLPGDSLQRRDARTLGVAARLKPGVTIEQAREDLGIAMAALGDAYADTNANLEPRIVPFRLGAGPQVYLVVFALLGAVVFVLLIACANIANLLLARAVDRTREVSVRVAIGASRWQIIRQLLLESLLLSATAGLIGFALAVVGVRLFVRAVTGTGEPYWLDFSMDLRVFGFFAAVCVGTALVFGLAPALHTSRMNVSEMLNESGRGAAGTLHARRWASALVVVQLALAPVLLTAAGLMMRTLVAVYQTEPGIDTSGVVRARVVLDEQAYPTAEARAGFYRRLDERLASARGMRAVLAAAAPTEGGESRPISFDGRPDVDADSRPTVTVMTVGPRYFDAVGAPVTRGRDFTATDGTSGDVAAIVNTRLAQLHFRGEDPIGRRIRLGAVPSDPAAAGPEWVTIVGVAPNIRQREMEDRSFDPIVYLPYAANPLAFASVIVRSNAEPGVVVGDLRAHVGAIDPDLPLFDVRTLDELIALEAWAFRVFGTMFSIFAAIALVIAGVGLYAVTARSVAQRTREIGVRVALGAEAREIAYLVSRRVALQLALGLAVGMAGAFGVGRLLESIILVPPRDAVTLIGVPMLLLAIAAAAAVVPTRRAMRLDPVAALRYE